MTGIYSIADPHLPVRTQVKKYDVPEDYFSRLSEYLEQKEPDVLLIAGDLIWGSDFQEVQESLNLIRGLPGRYKFFVEGNHDIWLERLGNSFYEIQGKMYEEFSSPDFYYIGGRALIFSIDSTKIGICGTRGFAFDTNNKPTEEDLKFHKLELKTLENALSQLNELVKVEQTTMNLCLLHYPPTVSVFNDSRIGGEEFLNHLSNSKLINKVIYGHVHIEKDIQIYTKIKNIELYCASINLHDYKAIKIFD